MKEVHVRLGAILLFVCCASTSITTENASGANLSQVLKDFTLSNNYGKPVALTDFEEKKVVVLAFLGTECPLAKLYGPRLSQLQESFADDSVAIIGISSNKQDSLTELTAYAHRYGINFPILKDVGNRLADEIGATRTPEVYVLDAKRDIRYQGRIDDQYGVGYSRERPEQSDLKLAIQSLLDGKSIATPKTKAIGCVIGRVKQATPTGDVTYTKHIAKILNSRCVECHRRGEIGPFTLTSYQDVLGWEETILEVIADKRMPPWNANPRFGHFKNDPTLSTTEVNLLKTWVENGMPEGNPVDLPDPPEFVEGWRIGEPDQIIAMSEESFEVPAEGIVDYQRFVVDPGWTDEKFISAAEARPDNRSVVHHILVYIIPPGKGKRDIGAVLAGYAPGSLPVDYGEAIALRVPAHSKLLFEMHYTPNGTKQRDLSFAGVKFAKKEQVKKLLRGEAVLDKEFAIPAGDANYNVTARPYNVRRNELLLSMTPHMHLRGKSFRYEAHYPDQTTEVLLDVPNYDFNWQLKYILKQPKLLPKGTKIVCSAVFDNSRRNLVNPDPAEVVRWGDQSDEEMMIGFFDTLPANR